MTTGQSQPPAAPSVTPFARAGRFRVVSWNVDGLERLCTTAAYQGNSLKTIADRCDADIVCIQETKMRKRDKQGRDVPLPARFSAADGYCVVASTAAYPNPANPLEGLWGVTVCTKKDSVVPIKAETGLAWSKRNSSLRDPDRIGHYPDLDALEIRVAELNTVEGEGRIVVLDCNVFVLISVYMPNLTMFEAGKRRDAARLADVLRSVLQARVEHLKAAGREVLVVGDFDTHVGYVEACKKPGQRWFAEMVSPTGCDLVDVLKSLHGGTGSGYTYFSGEQNKSRNLGTRIDLALATRGLMKWIKGAGTYDDWTGSDHLPIYVDLHESIGDPETGHVDLWPALNPHRSSPAHEVRLPQLACELEQQVRSQIPFQKFFQSPGRAAFSSTDDGVGTSSGRSGPSDSRSQSSGQVATGKRSAPASSTASIPGGSGRPKHAEVLDLTESEPESKGQGPIAESAKKQRVA
ncbi:hypothetical protein JCM3774_000064 [Rhodotorula dairenensis]